MLYFTVANHEEQIGIRSAQRTYIDFPLAVIPGVIR